MADNVASAEVAPPTELLDTKHIDFIKKLDDRKDSLHYWTSQHLKTSGAYWGTSALHLLHKEDVFERKKLIEFAVACQNSDGGFGGNVNQDSHMLYTLTALQILAMYDGLDQCDREACAKWVASMQLSDGSFQGDKWGEVDTRFSYIALSALQILGMIHLVDVAAVADWVMSCENWDGGFGVSPGAESHAGQIFCCLAALSIANAIGRVDKDRLGGWLAMRQLPSGGLNGRPEKKADVCYSWWVVSSLSMIDRQHWIDRDALFRFILACQDEDDGGIADKPGNQPDVYHTFFGLCGLRLLGYEGYNLAPINPVYAMPYDVLTRLGVTEERGLRVGLKEGEPIPTRDRA